MSSQPRSQSATIGALRTTATIGSTFQGRPAGWREVTNRRGAPQHFIGPGGTTTWRPPEETHNRIEISADDVSPRQRRLASERRAYEEARAADIAAKNAADCAETRAKASEEAVWVNTGVPSTMQRKGKAGQQSMGARGQMRIPPGAAFNANAASASIAAAGATSSHGTRSAGDDRPASHPTVPAPPGHAFNATDTSATGPGGIKKLQKTKNPCANPGDDCPFCIEASREAHIPHPPGHPGRVGVPQRRPPASNYQRDFRPWPMTQREADESPSYAQHAKAKRGAKAHFISQYQAEFQGKDKDAQLYQHKRVNPVRVAVAGIPGVQASTVPLPSSLQKDSYRPATARDVPIRSVPPRPGTPPPLPFLGVSTQRRAFSGRRPEVDDVGEPIAKVHGDGCGGIVRPGAGSRDPNRLKMNGTSTHRSYYPAKAPVDSHVMEVQQEAAVAAFHQRQRAQWTTKGLKGDFRSHYDQTYNDCEDLELHPCVMHAAVGVQSSVQRRAKEVRSLGIEC